MLRKARLAGKDNCSSVGMTFAEGSKGSGPCRAVFENVTDERRSGNLLEALKEAGESRKSRDHDLFDVDSGFSEPLESSCVSRFGVRRSFVEAGGNKEGSKGTKPTEGRFKSSRTSLIVNDACNVNITFGRAVLHIETAHLHWSSPPNHSDPSNPAL